MKGSQMDIDWRTVQLFLSDEGVAEVEIDSENSSKVRCNCKEFMRNARCKHQKRVKAHIQANHGHYTVMVPEDVPEETAIKAMADSKAMREFILKHAKIEVL
jgi:hypothetical protein